LTSALYVGVGGGLEALQFAYFSRRPSAIIAIEPVAAMRDAAARNLEFAAKDNPWFEPSFVEIREGDAFALPVPDASVDVVAQSGLPAAVCDKTATKLATSFPQDILITDSTWHYNGGGCC
jgi:ubiquinone/menaquinone biosynthesis C-methylase UbiE